MKKLFPFLLILIFGLSPMPRTFAFTDVAEEDNYYQAIQYLEENDIVDGYEDGSFKADNLINRAEFTKIIIGATMSYKQYAYYEGNCFPDVAEDWFAPYVCAAQANGIITGYPDGFFKPDQNINFAEAAKIIVNSFEYEVESGEPWYLPFENVLEEEGAIPASVVSADQFITRGEMAEMIYVLHSKAYPTDSECTLFTYTDDYNANLGTHCINQVTVKPIYFLAADQTDEIIPDWEENMEGILEKTKAFYEEQFDGYIEITLQEPELRTGEKNIDEYSSLVDEVFLDEISADISADHFTIYFVYYDSPTGSYGGASFLGINEDMDSLENNGSIALNPWFWLEDDALCNVSKYGTDCYGYVNSAHELGHSLGLSHPWDMEINRDLQGDYIDPTFKYSEEGNIMSYGGTSLLSGDLENPLGGYFVMDEAKEVMMR